MISDTKSGHSLVARVWLATHFPDFCIADHLLFGSLLFFKSPDSVSHRTRKYMHLQQLTMDAYTDIYSPYFDIAV